MTASNTFGRQVVLPLVNKSGGGVIAGDVVVVDTTNDRSFTTTTTAGFTKPLGVAQETIANNATGRVLVYGYAALVNVNASVTRGNFGATHTVAKQAADAGASRTTGTFVQFLTGGTTPDGVVYPVDLAGAALTNPMTTTQDVIVGGASGTPGRLGIGAVGGALSRINGLVAWNSGTSNPGSAVAGDRYWRSDLGLEIYYDGTRWLTAHEYVLSHSVQDKLNPLNTTGDTAGYSALDNATYDIWLVRIACSTTVLTTNTGSAYWTVQFARKPSATAIGSSFNTSGDTVNVNTRHDITVGALMGTSDRYIDATATKTSTPGNIYVIAQIIYRRVIT